MWILKDNVFFDDEFPFPNFVTTKILGDMKDTARRDKFCVSNGIEKQALVCARQVHGNTVVVAEKDDGGTFIENADGLVTAGDGMGLAMFTADCLPVFLGAKDRVCGIVHAGWRGLSKNIIISAVDIFKKEFRVLPADIMASIGPHICPKCYDIGIEVRGAFGLPETTVKFDLAAEAVKQLLTSGVRKISLNSHCTFHEPELFFSYRNDKIASRMMSVVQFK